MFIQYENYTYKTLEISLFQAYFFLFKNELEHVFDMKTFKVWELWRR